LWEIFEYRKKVRETKLNRVFDLIMGSCGFIFTYYLVSLEMFNNTFLFTATFILFSILEIWGYWAYRRKNSHD